MKKLVAVAMALLLGLFAQTALAEAEEPFQSQASIVRLSDLALAFVDETGSRSVRFDGSSLTAAIGNPGGAPTLQLNFDNGNGQMVDGVVQLADQQVLLSMGGISGTYAVDLQALAGEENNADDAVRSLTKVLSLAGSHLDVVLYAVTLPEEDGMRAVEVPLPMPTLITTAESLLSVTQGLEATQDVDMDGLHDQMEAMNDEAVMKFRYSPETGAFELSAVQSGKAMCLSGTMELTSETMTFINIIDDEQRLDALHLTPLQLEELRGELDMVLVKYANFITAIGLDDIMP